LRKLFTAAVMAGAVLLLGVGATGASSIGASDQEPAFAGSHDLPGPLAQKQRALRDKALKLQLKGTIAAGATTAKVGKGKTGKFVELSRKGEDSIWTLLVDFGDQPNTHNHGAFGVINHGGAPGPVHNQLPKPDRTKDNITIWSPNFDRAHYMDLLFSDTPGKSTMRNYYLEASSGQYTVNGDVTDWTKVPYNEAAYGSNYCGSIVCVRDIQRLLEDGLTAWWNNQIAAGKTPAEINAYLSRFDKWDRNDQDGDGNFNEPDGYIDHFQTVHAGAGEETGGGAEGTNAIWSHRSTLVNGQGSIGPTLDDGTVVTAGGVPVGGSKYWVADYTVEPENGGVGVFAHEFGHDLGLPDEYDTSGNTGGAENSTGWWTNWSQGSYGSDGTPQDGIGNRPIGMTTWERWELGWLNAAVFQPGDKSARLTLGPSEFQTTQPQAAIVNLPDQIVTNEIGKPFAGSKFFYSGTNDDLDISMLKPVTLPAGASLTAKVRYNIEEDWDYAYLVVSTDGGKTFTNVATNLSVNTSPNGQNFGNGITGVSTNGDWVTLTADLSAFSGNVLIGFRYWTDGAQQGTPDAPYTPGFSADEIAITGLATDGAETDTGWTFVKPFRITTGTEDTPYPHAYFVENRQYIGPDRLRVGFDWGLKTSPYNTGGGSVPATWRERFPYQDGVLIWYWNSEFANNNVGDHPGQGEILPVDAHPGLLHWSDGTLMRPRIQSYDATFGVKKTDSITLHQAGVPTTIPSQKAVPTFDDTQNWWTASDPADATSFYKAEWNSVKVPNTGARVDVRGAANSQGYVNIEVTPPPAK
jgi:immune inhibitor A